MDVKNKNLVVSSTKIDKDYQSLLQELKNILSNGQYKAYQAIDNIRVQTYWQAGERIVREELKHKDRADYGKYLIDNLVIDLKIKRRELYKIIKFYRYYSIVPPPRAQLSWTHYKRLIELDNGNRRSFYENNSILHSWSIRELDKQIKSDLYENTPQAGIEAVFKTKLPAIKTQKVFKGTYDFDFIESHQKEKDLENKIIENFEMFLKEMGEYFSILGRQVPIKIDNETHFIDLVLYHRGIPCIILADLKAGKLDSRDVGQMNKYIGYYRRNKQFEHEKDTIGLIICKETGTEEVIYALDGLEKKIFIAKYKLKLPSEDKIRKAIKD